MLYSQSNSERNSELPIRCWVVKIIRGRPSSQRANAGWVTKIGEEGSCDGIKGIDFPQSRRHGAALAGAVGRQEVEEAAQLDWPPDQTSSEIGLIR